MQLGNSKNRFIYKNFRHVKNDNYGQNSNANENDDDLDDPMEVDHSNDAKIPEKKKVVKSPKKAKRSGSMIGTHGRVCTKTNSKNKNMLFSHGSLPRSIPITELHKLRGAVAKDTESTAMMDAQWGDVGGKPNCLNSRPLSQFTNRMISLGIQQHAELIRNSKGSVPTSKIPTKIAGKEKVENPKSVNNENGTTIADKDFGAWSKGIVFGCSAGWLEHLANSFYTENISASVKSEVGFCRSIQVNDWDSVRNSDKQLGSPKNESGVLSEKNTNSPQKSNNLGSPNKDSSLLSEKNTNNPQKLDNLGSPKKDSSLLSENDANSLQNSNNLSAKSEQKTPTIRSKGMSDTLKDNLKSFLIDRNKKPTYKVSLKEADKGAIKKMRRFLVPFSTEEEVLDSWERNESSSRSSNESSSSSTTPSPDFSKATLTQKILIKKTVLKQLRKEVVEEFAGDVKVSAEDFAEALGLVPIEDCDIVFSVISVNMLIY